jgi:hypothetical protein
MKWIGAIVPNGEEVTFKGDIESIHRQVLDLNSNFLTDFPTNHTDIEGRALSQRSRSGRSFAMFPNWMLHHGEFVG